MHSSDRCLEHSSVHRWFVNAWFVVLGENAVHDKINVIVRLSDGHFKVYAADHGVA